MNLIKCIVIFFTLTTFGDPSTSKNSLSDLQENTYETLAKIEKILNDPSSITQEEYEKIRDKLQEHLLNLNTKLKELKKILENATDEEREEIEKKIEELSAAIIEITKALSFINSELEAREKFPEISPPIHKTRDNATTTNSNFSLDIHRPTHPTNEVLNWKSNRTSLKPELSTPPSIPSKIQKANISESYATTIKLNEDRPPITIFSSLNSQINSTSINSPNDFFSNIDFNKKALPTSNENVSASSTNKNIEKAEQKNLKKEGTSYSKNSNAQQDSFLTNLNFGEKSSLDVTIKNEVSAIKTFTISTNEPLQIEEEIAKNKPFYEYEYETEEIIEEKRNIEEETYLKTVQKESLEPIAKGETIKPLIEEKPLFSINSNNISDIKDWESYTYNLPSKIEKNNEARKEKNNPLPKWVIAFKKELSRGLSTLTK